MALTADQWYLKIKKFVPSWYFTNDEKTVCYTRGSFKAIAAVFAQLQADTDSQQAATFIMQSSAPVLDLLGDERSLARRPGEIDATYAPEVRDVLFLPVGITQLQAVVNAALNNGVGFFRENAKYGFWDEDNGEDDTFFWDCGNWWLEREKFYNWWILVIPYQTANAAQVLIDVIAAIESNKALGTTYDVLYDNEGHLVTEGGEALLTEDGEPIFFEEAP